MFNFFRRNNGTSESQEVTAFFKNGLLIKVLPKPRGRLYDNRDIYYNARYIVSDGHKYDLENVDSIKSIRTPRFKNFNTSNLGIAGNLTYVLRMKASQLKKSGKNEIALVLLKRATEMMPVSEVSWSKKDYMRFPQWLIEECFFDEAERVKKEIDSLFVKQENEICQINIRNAKSLGTDLVEADYFKGCCSECAKYRGRWFSISGKDRRFPKMPVNYGCTCQGIEFSPVIYGVSEPIYCPKSRNIIEYSNRPFIDDRSKKEKADYDMYKKERDNELWYDQYAQKIEKIRAFDKKNYYKIKKQIPEIAPKSFSGYMRMKNSNSKNYQKLVSNAAQMDINLNYPRDMQQEWQDLKPITEQYKRVKAECYAYWEAKKRK